jgi:hypothetical protein
LGSQHIPECAGFPLERAPTAHVHEEQPALVAHVCLATIIHFFSLFGTVSSSHASAATDVIMAEAALPLPPGYEPAPRYGEHNECHLKSPDATGSTKVKGRQAAAAAGACQCFPHSVREQGRLLRARPGADARSTGLRCVRPGWPAPMTMVWSREGRQRARAAV